MEDSEDGEEEKEEDIDDNAELDRLDMEELIAHPEVPRAEDEEGSARKDGFKDAFDVMLLQCANTVARDIDPRWHIKAERLSPKSR